MTEPLIKLPSVIIKELQAEIANQKTELTIHVKESLVDYVQNLYPDATVVAK